MSDAQPPPNEEESPRAGCRESAREVTPGRNRAPDLDGRVRIATLEAQARRLEEQRDTLRERVADLETQVQALEEERSMLETTLEQERKQRQQMIERYERILDRRESDDGPEPRPDGVTQYVSRLLRRLRSISSRHL